MTYDIDVVQRQEQPAAVVHGHADTAHIAEFVSHAFSAVASVVEQEHLSYAGAPFGRYAPHQDGSFDIEAGFPVAGAAVPEGEVEIVMLPGGPTARTMHVGPYSGIGAAYAATSAWIAAHGYAVAGPPWESYLDGPEVANPRTEVCFPIRRA